MIDDAAVRGAIYQHLFATGVVPAASDLTAALETTVDDIRTSLRRLSDAHIVVLQAGGEEILMAAPFSAVPTSFLVTAGDVRSFANCVWDALGVLAILHRDGRVDAACGCCGAALTLRVEGGRLLGGNGIVHYAVPARRWWDDIVFT